MHCNNCWSFKHALNIVPSKNLPFFIKTPLIPAHFNTRHLFSRNSVPCPLMNFGQRSATLSQHSTRTSSRNLELGDILRPSPCPASLSPKLHPFPTHQWSHASTLRRCKRQCCRAPCRRRSSCCRTVTAAGPCGGSRSSAPPKNRRHRRPPPKRAREVTKQAAGPAAVD